ncbi:MAG: glycosyltransferase family 4 protein [Sphingobacteriaceae bacterium]|nr:glycosyltransferase family 4 protein [Cytophagaceae bacterium]
MPAPFPHPVSMRILYVYQFFRTPAEGGILRAYYLATALAEAGHRVDIITSHTSTRYEKKCLDGLTVHYLPVAYDQRYGFARRVVSYLKFALLALGFALRQQDVERVYAASVPLTVGLVALGMNTLRGVPYFFEVGDLWPQTPIEMGMIKNGLLKKVLFAFERLVYRRAERIVALSPGIQASIESRGGAGKTVCLPNLADCDFFRPGPKIPEFERRYATTGKLVVTYFGAMGRVVGLEALIDAARFCQSRSDRVLFLLVGDGSERPGLQRLVADCGLTNLRFLDPVGKTKLRDLLNVTDLAYVSFLPLPVLQTNSPNKLFDALAAGKPLVMNLRGWHTDRLEAEGAGWYVPPDQPEAFWNRMEAFLQNPAALAAAGCRARHLAETRFSRTQLSAQFLAWFDEKAP